MGVEVLPGLTLNDKQTAGKRRDALLPRRVPSWAQQCFNGVAVGIGAGHSIDPLWFLDRRDNLELRRVLARAVLNATAVLVATAALVGTTKKPTLHHCF